MTEAQVREAGIDYAVKVQAYGDVAYGWAMEDTTGFCKVLAERGTGRILGAHVMGPQASTVVQPLIQAMAFGTPARELATGSTGSTRRCPRWWRTRCWASTCRADLIAARGAGRSDVAVVHLGR
jgi:hypothetical protein